MTARAAGRVLQHLRQALRGRDGGERTDDQLLESYLRHREEEAFEALVRRHGPMVLGVCLRLLGNPHDAEDAFQATFLVLVRKANSIVPRALVGNWLYGVAHTTALRARAAAARRRVRERQVVALPEPEAPGQFGSHELQLLLDQELSRLPDRYRAPVVLCDLEGKTRKEAARLLGWPEGTVAGRLARARALLAGRLARKGFALSGGALAITLAREAPGAGVPASLITTTVKAARLGAVGRTAPVNALVEGVLKAMLIAKLKIAGLLLLMGAVLGGAVAVTFPLRAAEKAARKEAPSQEKPRAAKDQLAGLRQQLGASGWVLADVLPGNHSLNIFLGSSRQFSKPRLPQNGWAIYQGFSPLVIENLAVPRAAEIWVDGKKARFADLRPGMYVSFRFAKGGTNITAVGARTPAPELFVKAVHAAENSLTVEIKQQGATTLNLPVARNAFIVVNNKRAKLADLKPGMGLILTLGPGGKDWMAVRRIEAFLSARP